MSISINVTAKEAVDRALELCNWHYIYGYKYGDNPVTKAKIQQLARDNSQVYTDAYYDKACKFIGERAIDCSGLVCHALNISDIGSYDMRERGNKGDGFIYYPFDSISRLKSGDVLWKQGHVGIVDTVWSDRYQTAEAYTIDRPVERRMWYQISPWQAILRPKYKEEVKEENMTEVYPVWIKESDGSWWYKTGPDKGDYPRNTYFRINGELYYFDREGYVSIPRTTKSNPNGSINVEYVRYHS